MSLKEHVRRALEECDPKVEKIMSSSYLSEIIDADRREAEKEIKALMQVFQK